MESYNPKKLQAVCEWQNATDGMNDFVGEAGYVGCFSRLCYIGSRIRIPVGWSNRGRKARWAKKMQDLRIDYQILANAEANLTTAQQHARQLFSIRLGNLLFLTMPPLRIDFDFEISRLCLFCDRFKIQKYQTQDYKTTSPFMPYLLFLVLIVASFNELSDRSMRCADVLSWLHSLCLSHDINRFVVHKLTSLQSMHRMYMPRFIQDNISCTLWRRGLNPLRSCIVRWLNVYL